MGPSAPARRRSWPLRGRARASWLAGLISLVGLILLWPACVRAQTASEYAAKAAFIYNIALFTTFPSTDAGLIRLCVLGRNPFDGALQTLQGKAVGSARLTVEHPGSVAEAMKRCQILFISESEADSLQVLAEAARDAAVLSVADIRGAAKRGVMLELSVQEQRIGFEFNGAVARSANIALSSKVLRLAKAVY